MLLSTLSRSEKNVVDHFRWAANALMQSTVPPHPCDGYQKISERSESSSREDNSLHGGDLNERVNVNRLFTSQWQDSVDGLLELQKRTPACAPLAGNALVLATQCPI